MSHVSCLMSHVSCLMSHVSCLMSHVSSRRGEVAGLVAHPLPLGEMSHVVAQLGCDRGLHQHVNLRVQSVPVVGGVNVLVDTAM